MTPDALRAGQAASKLKASDPVVNDSGVDPFGITAPAVPSEVLAALRMVRAPVVIAHVVPDTDALGAAFALATASATGQCRPRVSLPDGSLSQRIEFLREWANPPRATRADFAAADAFIVLDTAKKGRCNIDPSLKDTDWSAGRPLINIDHHQTNTRFGTINWVVETAGSTSELVYYLLRAADLPITATVASLLYAGIQTDTLGFSLPTTSASALAAAAALVAAGAAVGDLGERLYRSQRLSEFQLLRTIYDNTRILCDGELAYSSASHDEIHAAGCRAADIDDQISVPRSLIGVRLAMLFTEGNKGKTRINFRSSEDVTVSDLAARFKGGGHLQAAGAVLDLGLKETMELVVPQAVEHLKSFRKPAAGREPGA